MLKYYTAVSLVATALTAAPALAQNTTTPSTPAQSTTATGTADAKNAAAGDRNYLKDETPGTWRASKMIGLGVYNEQDQKVGNINEVLFDKSGRLEGVVIGVGGFLGIGERNVAVPYGDLQWSMTPAGRTTSTTGIGAPGNPTTTGPGANPAALGNATAVGSAGTGTPLTPNAPATASAGADNQTAAYPDHAILANASKEQLQNAPQFNYGPGPR